MSSTTSSPLDVMDKESQNIFVLGLGVLFGWMLIILICASPQLFRDYIKKGCCESENKKTAAKIRQAEARVQAMQALAEKPSEILLGQVNTMSVRLEKARMSIALSRMEEGLVPQEADEDLYAAATAGPSSSC